MKDAHLTEDEIKLALEGSDEHRNRLILHHLAVCRVCYAEAGHILDLYLAGELDAYLGTIEIDLGKSRRSAPALWERLRGFPFDRQKALIREVESYRSWGLCELLCAESEKEAPRDPTRARSLSELAVAVSAALEPNKPAEPLWLDELRAYAFAHLANAYRVGGDLAAAEEAFMSAEALWKPAMENLGDVLGYEARYLALLSSLRRAQRRLPEALELLDRALAAYPEPSLLVRILINRAKTMEELGDIREAIEILAAAQSRAEAEIDPRLRLCLVQNHLDYLSKAGRLVEAEALVVDVETLVEEIGCEIDLLRLRWTQARISQGLGRIDEALRLFEEVRVGFAHHDIPYDVVLVALELSLAYQSCGRTEDVLEVIQETIPILQAVSVEREGLMAVRLLTEATSDRRATAELIGQVLEYLRRSQPQPLP